VPFIVAPAEDFAKVKMLLTKKIDCSNLNFCFALKPCDSVLLPDVYI
jgi:hypothetical protein